MTSQNEISKAVNILKAGGLVAFPTETVYGLGADANNASAVEQIFAAKERPYHHPLIVHIADTSHLENWARDIPLAAQQLAKAFWPGPLTLILKKQPHVLDKVTGGQDTVGLRVPSHPVAQAVLVAFGGGIAAPSANKFTHISPTTAQAVWEELEGRVGLILDGGDCAVGLESTILDLSEGEPVILRPGMISADAIAAVLNRPVSMRRQDAPGPIVPGMHHLHYAPVTQTVLVASSTIPAFIAALKPEELPIALLVYNQREAVRGVSLVKMPNHPEGYAHQLYRSLRALDNLHLKQIIIEDVPTSLGWIAIRDRLLKASGR